MTHGMRHRDQVLALLQKQIGNPVEVKDIRETAESVMRKWTDPTKVGHAEINGLIYGLIQSGKTGVLTVTGAMGADEGYGIILILTSDIDPLYEQTLSRIHQAFPGIDILGKADFKDVNSFVQRVKNNTCAIVSTKNGTKLRTLCENFRAAKLKGVSCLMIDDEADQASLNTKESKADGTRSTINSRIGELRSFFERNTYLQVTATPQALFLQTPGHDFRPQFTVLSHPGAEYVGGEDFFGDDSKLVREFPLDDITALTGGDQPDPRLTLPNSLLRALDTFMIGATYKRMRDADENCAFLCHVSTKTADHAHIVSLLRRYKTDIATGIKSGNASLLKRLKAAHEDLAATHAGMRGEALDSIVSAIEFFSPGINVKMVNGETDEDVAVVSPFNLFVGGNKLGRGVTIRNLLVSYYGRHPRRPQADTVLQHARMYGYRRKDIGLLRLFLPEELNVVFRAINRMERGLRDLIERRPSERFRGVYVEGVLNPTRKNVLAPGAVGIYSGGSNYNPAQVKRDAAIIGNTKKIDALLESVPNQQAVQMSISELRGLIELTMPDDSQSDKIWNPIAVSESLEQFGKLHDVTKGFVYVDRNRNLKERRSETQGVLSGGEIDKVPKDQLVLFMLRTTATKDNHEAWWPQVRFPDGGYAFAFAI